MLSFDELMSPVWKSDIIYDESLTMVCKDGVCKAPLLFQPEAILSVTSADKMNIYEEGVDWVLEGQEIILTPNSNIFCFQEEELTFEYELPGQCFKRLDGKYELFSEEHFFHDRQISVTYRKKAGHLDIQPEPCKCKLPRTIKKLENRKTTKILLYGDSISAGSNSSAFTGVSPFQPSWGKLVVDKLERHYQTEVEFVNTSVGGMASNWGAENAFERVAVYEPDLAIIAFGMNDRVPGEQFLAWIQEVIRVVRTKSPNTEFILCGTTMPNRELEGFLAYQEEYAEQLRTLAETGIVVADFGNMQAELLKVKRFIDLTGNNVNHPNDFMIRCHAQFIAEMLLH